MKSLQLHKPHLLVVVGLPGAGKSHFASQFSDNFSTPYLDINRYKRLIRNNGITDTISNDVFHQLLKTNQTLLIEGVGETSDERKELLKVAKIHGYEVLYIWVQTEPATASQRATKSKEEPISVDEFKKRSRRFENLNATELFVVVSGRHTYASQTRMVLNKLVAKKPETRVNPTSRPSTSSGRINVN